MNKQNKKKKNISVLSKQIPFKGVNHLDRLNLRIFVCYLQSLFDDLSDDTDISVGLLEDIINHCVNNFNNIEGTNTITRPKVNYRIEYDNNCEFKIVLGWLDSNEVEFIGSPLDLKQL